MGRPGAEDLLLATQADTEGWYGKLKNAHELTRRAMDSAQHNDAKETAGDYLAAAALREVESGNREQARAEANAALKLAPNRDVQAMGALALARAGDTAGAEKLAAELNNISAEHVGSKILVAHNPGGRRLGAQGPEPRNRTIEGGEHDRT
jgi:tetratricopeptide (TPR) repeat protein